MEIWNHFRIEILKIVLTHSWSIACKRSANQIIPLDNCLSISALVHDLQSSPLEPLQAVSFLPSCSMACSWKPSSNPSHLLDCSVRFLYIQVPSGSQMLSKATRHTTSGTSLVALVLKLYTYTSSVFGIMGYFLDIGVASVCMLPHSRSRKQC